MTLRKITKLLTFFVTTFFFKIEVFIYCVLSLIKIKLGVKKENVKINKKSSTTSEYILF